MKKLSVISLIFSLLFVFSCEDKKDTTPPEVTILSPSNGSTVNEIITITCLSTDNSGVKKVELWIDGVSTGITDSSEPFSFEWNTSTHEDGEHIITIRSIDDSGNKTDSEPVTVIVDNSDYYPTPIILYSGLYTNNSFVINWTKSSDNDFESYTLYESTSENMDDGTIIFNSQIVTDTTFVVLGITENILRFYQIIVTDSVGLGSSSTIESGSSFPKIVFTSVRNGDSEIYLMDIYGKGQNNLTNSLGWDGFQQFSPDGLKILFESSRNGMNGDVYIMNVDGSNVINLTDDDRSNGFSRFSSDGLKIVYLSNSDVFIMDINGDNKINLTNNVHGEKYPEFSPDGSKVVYNSWRNQIDDIYIINVDGSNEINLTNHSSPDFSPQFSPDGSKIIFISRRGENGILNLFIMDKDGSNISNLTNGIGVTPLSGYQISPDGSKIVFSTGGDTFIMDIDGNNQINLTNNIYTEYSPEFSPDGSKIVFVSTRDGTPEIYIMDLDGSNQTRLTNNTWVDSYPRFQPQ